MIMGTIITRKHRLHGSLYTARVISSFTLCLESRHELFRDVKVVEEFKKRLIKSLETNHCKDWVYIFMPDHFHVVLEGMNEEADLLKAVVGFKQATGYWMRINLRGYRWQKSYYDHILRSEDDLKTQISYILENPVRKGLVNKWQDYPFSGSTSMDIKNLVTG